MKVANIDAALPHAHRKPTPSAFPLLFDNYRTGRHVVLLLLESCCGCHCRCNNAPSVARDHEFFVGQDGPHGNRARLGLETLPDHSYYGCGFGYRGLPA